MRRRHAAQPCSNSGELPCIRVNVLTSPRSTTRPPLKFPDGVRLVVWPVLSLEEWDMARPMARMVITPPQGQPMLPDHPNWTWHEYGMRVGFWRLKKLFERLKISPDDRAQRARLRDLRAGRPRLRRRRLGTQRPRLRPGADAYARRPEGLDREDDRHHREILGQAAARLVRPRPDADLRHHSIICRKPASNISATGCSTTNRSRSRPRTSRWSRLPYNFELHDIVLMALQHQIVGQMYRRVIDAFDVLYAESADRAPRSWRWRCIPISPACRTASATCEKMFEEMLAKPGVACWDGVKILDWYLSVRK